MAANSLLTALTGDGTVSGGVRVGNGATIDPTGGSGAGPATLAVGGTVFQPGWTYSWRLNGVEAGPRTQSLLSSSSALDLTGLSAASRFVIKPVTLTADDAAGPLTDFNNSTAYTWTLCTFSGGITGFAADKFTVDASGFANPLGDGVFAVGQSGNSLTLTFSRCRSRQPCSGWRPSPSPPPAVGGSGGDRPCVRNQGCIAQSPRTSPVTVFSASRLARASGREVRATGSCGIEWRGAGWVPSCGIRRYITTATWRHTADRHNPLWPNRRVR